MFLTLISFWVSILLSLRVKAFNSFFNYLLNISFFRRFRWGVTNLRYVTNISSIYPTDTIIYFYFPAHFYELPLIHLNTGSLSFSSLLTATIDFPFHLCDYCTTMCFSEICFDYFAAYVLVTFVVSVTWSVRLGIRPTWYTLYIHWVLTVSIDFFLF